MDRHRDLEVPVPARTRPVHGDQEAVREGQRQAGRAQGHHAPGNRPEADRGVPQAAQSLRRQHGTAFLAKWLEREEVTKKRGDDRGDEVVAAGQGDRRSCGMTDTDEGVAGSGPSLASASTVMIVGLAAAMVIGIVLAIFITRSITGPIRRIIDGLTEGAEQVASAAGQVSARGPVAGRGLERAGGLDRGDLLVAGGDVLHDQAERRQRQPGQQPDERGQAGGGRRPTSP